MTTDLAPAAHPAARPAVFFDRDNTLIVGSEYLGDPAGVALMEGAARCVAGARQLGFAVVTVSNQSGVARGMFGEEDVWAVDARMDALLRDADPEATVDAHEYCPHHPEAVREQYRASCDCRKPLPGMLRRAAAALGLNLSQSWMIGDAPRDIEAGAAAGCRTILLSVPGVAPSPAASARQRVAPDFRAASLDEALAILRDQTRRAAAPPVAAADERTAEALTQILDFLRRGREVPHHEFNVLRLLAGVVQVMALGALMWGLISDRHAATLSVAIFLQLLALTLVAGSSGR